MGISTRVWQEMRNLGLALRAGLSPLPGSVENDVPFVCQFATPESAERSLKKELRAVDDLHWALSGAVSPERYAQWAFTMCGMACTAMALRYFSGDETQPAALAEDALSHGVYKEHAEEISSMHYKEYATWARSHGLKANIYSRLTIGGICHLLSRGMLVMVSVNPNIRGYETAPRSQKGGHLVLVTGYERAADTITINNPSGFLSTNTQKGYRVRTKDFKRFFAGRGIALRLLAADAR